MNTAYGISPSIGTLFNSIKKLGLTRKKKTFSDPKKDEKAVHIKEYSKNSMYQKTAYFLMKHILT